jgi:predicted anti-sigma-YlaC factor YlaD
MTAAIPIALGVGMYGAANFFEPHSVRGAMLCIFGTIAMALGAGLLVR